MNKQTIKRSQIEEWDIDRLMAYKHNAKLHPDSHVDQIANSIEEFTFLDPVAVDEKGELLEGHGRLLAAKKRGDTTIPVIQVTGLTEAQKVAYRLTHNKLTMNTGFDPEMLKIDFEFLQDEGFDLDLTGFSGLELSFLDEEEDDGGEGEGGSGEDDFDPPEEIVSRVKLGEVWQLGRHFICCGDSTIESNVKALLGDRFGDVGMVWADPPYGINAVDEKTGQTGGLGRTGEYGYSFGGSKSASKPIKNKKYAPIAGDNTLDAAINSSSLSLDLFPKSMQIWWGANNYSANLPNSNCWLIWDKQTDALFADAEIAWTNKVGAIRLFTHKWSGVCKASEHGQERVHPTQKPIALCEWAFEKYGKPDDVIFDPFLGSGISIIAAQKMEGDRTVYGFELSVDYCEVICQRFFNLTGIEPVLVGHLDLDF